MEQIRISDAEWKIMKTLWNSESPAMTLGEIISALGEDNRWSYTTVRTLIVRLIDKGAVSADKPPVSTATARYRMKRSA